MRKFCYCRGDKPETLIDFLARRFPYNSKNNWMKCVLSGAIKVNNQPALPQVVLKNRDNISYNRPRSEEPEIDDRYNILYDDDRVLAVEKSGDIPVAESGRYYYNTLLNVLKERENYRQLFAVHRLDRETSGVILIAKTKEVAAQLGKQFADNIPDKIYHAVLTGEFEEKQVMVEAPIKKSSMERSKIRIRQVIDPLGKASKTLFTAEKISGGLTLARVKTYSGRTHQIRCHAEHIGHPVLGDKLYGQTDERFIELFKVESEPVFPPFGKISRQALHASSLSFIHPRTGEKMTFTSDYQKEFSRHSFLERWLAGVDGQFSES